MSLTDTQLRELFLSTVPRDGSTVGNVKLLGLITAQDSSVDKKSFERVRDALVEEGVLGKGEGTWGVGFPAFNHRRLPTQNPTSP